MSRENDGGPAFPHVWDAPPGPGIERTVMVEGGMSLRDYFAAKALQSLILSGQEVRCAHPDGTLVLSGRDGFSMLAYQYADAMLKAREA